MATLAAILVVVAYHMSEWRTFRSELRSPKSDVAVLLVTFAFTVWVDLTVAIGAGMALAAFLFVRRMANATDVNVFEHVANELPRRSIPPGVEVYEINGPFFYGAAEKFKDTLALIAGKPKVLIIRMQGVSVIDATGMHALRDVMRRSRSEGTLMMLSDVQSQPLAALRNSAPADATQQGVICSTFDEAINRATQYLEPR